MKSHRWARAAAAAAAIGMAACIGAAAPGAQALTPTAGATISGTINDANGSPITTQDVCAAALTGSSSYFNVVSTPVAATANGTYTISGLQPGSYRVAFGDCKEFGYFSGGSGAATSSRNDLGQYWVDTTPPTGTSDPASGSLVNLSDQGQKTGVNAQLQPATSISGTVTGPDGTTGAGQICVSTETPATGNPGYPGYPGTTTPPAYGPFSYHEATSSANGSYTLDYLSPGQAQTVVFRDCATPKRYLTQYMPGASDRLPTSSYTPTLASPVTGVNATLALGATISGVIKTASGAAITSDVCVSAQRQGDSYNQPNPDDGWGYYDQYSSGPNATDAYTIGGLAAGSYTVEFRDCGYTTTGYPGAQPTPARNDVTELYKGVEVDGTPTPVPATLGQTTPNIDAALVAGASISGHVYVGSGNGTPVTSEACVRAYPAGAADGYGTPLGQASTTAGGAYTIPGLDPNRQIKVTFSSPCYVYGQGGQVDFWQGASSFATATAFAASGQTDIDGHLVAPSVVAPTTRITGGPADQASTKATTATFTFASTDPNATFQCTLDGSTSPCDSPFATGTLASGPHMFSVAASDNGVTETSPPSVSWTVNPSSQQTTSEGSAAAGGTVSSDPGQTASPSNPATADVTLPTAGTVTLTKEPATTADTNGYHVFGEQIEIAATDPSTGQPIVGTSAHPISLSFTIDGSAIPSGTALSTVTVERNGQPAPNCAANDGTASPDPCIAGRTPTADGGVTLTVLTTHCSTWNFATAAASAPTTTTTTPTTTTPTTTPTPTPTTPTTTAPAPAPAPGARAGGGTTGGSVVAQLVAAVTRSLQSQLIPSLKTVRTELLLGKRSILTEHLVSPGTLAVTVFGTAKAHRKASQVVVLTGTVTSRAAGPVKLALTATKAGRALLAAARKAHAKTTFTVLELFSPTVGGKAVAVVSRNGHVTVAFPAPKHQAKAGR